MLRSKLYRHVLAASDGSVQGQRALAAACELALQCADRLTLLHVLPASQPVSADQQIGSDEQLAQLEHDARALLQPFHARALALGLACETELIPGLEAWRVIDDRSQSLGCDLLVLGLHMRAWLGDASGDNQRKLLTLGSTLEVLLVP